MCNIAGYVGTGPAAPVLLEMICREEGWAGGYYTGLATIHEGEIHYAKVVGSLKDLLETTDAASFPGSIGIIHSRSNSGGDEKWAHPFVSKRNGRVTTAYVANGGQGCFAAQQRDVAPLAVRLNEAGYCFDSRVPFAVRSYPILPDGTCVHMSDVMAQLIASRIDEGNSADSAMRAAFREMPSEIVGLLLSIAEPECISWSRVNAPMFVGFAGHGAYLASTPQAFPDDAGEAALLPAMSCGQVFSDHFTVRPFEAPLAHIAPITPRLIRESAEIVEQKLSEAPQTLSDLIRLVKPLFEPAESRSSAALCYMLLADLQRENRLRISVENLPGVRDDLTAPKFFASLK